MKIDESSVPDAIEAYQRALVSSEPGENDTALRIGRLYALQGDSFAARQYHQRALYEGLKTGATKFELSRVYLWLAKWEMDRGGEGDLTVAEQYLQQAVTVNEVKEEAKALLKHLGVLMLNRE